MSTWPSDYGQAWTLASSVERTGIGLHSGGQARVRLEPSDRPGYRVGWLDAPDLGLVGLAPEQVCETQLCTALQLNQRRLATVEHLLAALAGVGITAATILVDGSEIPLLDGSAQPWVEAIAEAGMQSLGDRPTALPPPAPNTPHARPRLAPGPAAPVPGAAPAGPAGARTRRRLTGWRKGCTTCSTTRRSSAGFRRGRAAARAQSRRASTSTSSRPLAKHGHRDPCPNTI